jgi:hypothetical protein
VSCWKGTLSSTLSSGCLRVRHRLGSSDDPARHRTDACAHDASHPESPAPILTAFRPEPLGTTLTDPWLDSGARPTPHERGRTVANDRIVRRWLSSLRHRCRQDARGRSEVDPQAGLAGSYALRRRGHEGDAGPLTET